MSRDGKIGCGGHGGDDLEVLLEGEADGGGEGTDDGPEVDSEDGDGDDDGADRGVNGTVALGRMARSFEA